MSHEVVFLPHILGQTWAQALAAARTAAREEDPRIVAARLEPWPDLVLHAAQILGQIEEYRGRGQRELVHPVTRLRFTFFGEDGVIALPYWYDGPVARMAATMAFRFAHAVESDTGLAAYDPQQRTPLAEMGLEKFVAGYLRGREKALDQVAARGPVPVGHELPTGRSASRRELAAGPSGGGGSSARGGDGTRGGAGDARRSGGDSGRPARDSGRPADSRRRGGKSARGEEPGGRGAPAAPRKTADQRPPTDGGSPTSAGRLRRVEPPGRGQEAVRREREQDAAAGRGQEPVRGDRERDRDRDAAAGQRRAAQPMRGEDFGARDSSARPAKSAARRPPADSGGQKPPRPRQNPDARGPEDSGKSSGGGWLRRGSKASRGEDPQRSRKPQRGTPAPPGSEWVPRPGSPERGVPPDPRAKRPERPAQGGRPDPRRGPQPQSDDPPGGQDPQGRRRPPELPKGH